MTAEERAYLHGWTLAARVLQAAMEDADCRLLLARGLARGGLAIARGYYVGELRSIVGLTDFDRGNADAYLAAWGWV